MARVLILHRVSGPSTDPFLEALMKNHTRLANKYSLIYRETLAAKTFKNNDFVEKNKALFERELNLWLNIDSVNVARLLKVVSVDNTLYALMPCYKYNLREIMTREVGLTDAKSIVVSIIRGLHEVFDKSNLVHQDLKPENILVDVDKDNVYFFVSDWGIANLQRTLCPAILSKELLQSFVDTITGMGTLPYMSPERFINYSTHVTADVFGLGMIFFELLFGHLPYDFQSGKTMLSQIIDHDYFHIAEYLLRENFNQKVRSVILKCIHPDISRRYSDYKQLVVEINSC
jgi:serine/threonine protein kinase